MDSIYKLWIEGEDSISWPKPEDAEEASNIDSAENENESVYIYWSDSEINTPWPKFKDEEPSSYLKEVMKRYDSLYKLWVEEDDIPWPKLEEAMNDDKSSIDENSSDEGLCSPQISEYPETPKANDIKNIEDRKERKIKHQQMLEKISRRLNFDGDPQKPEVELKVSTLSSTSTNNE